MLNNSLSVLQYSSFRLYLKDVLATTQRSSPKFSLRAFAKELDVSVSTLSNLISGKRVLSAETANKVAEKLKLSRVEGEHWLAICALPKTKSVLAPHFEQRARATKKKVLLEKDFSSLVNWYSIALIEALRIPKLEQNLCLISKAIGISEKVLAEVLDGLVQKKIMQKNAEGKFVKTSEFFQLFSNGPSEGLRKINRQMLRIANEKIRPETTHERYLAFETFAFDPHLLPQAKEIINQCLDQLSALSIESQNRTAVYHAGVQFFKLLDDSVARNSKKDVG